MPNSNSYLEICAVESRASTVYGVGVNCITGGLVIGPSALSAFTKLSPTPRELQRTTVRVIQSSNDYSDFMNANASVSVSGLSWSATATVAFASQHASSDTAMSFVAVRDVRSSDIYLDIANATISADALALLRGPDGPNQFLRRYGTHCVIGVSYGGSFSGYIRLQTSSASEKESLATSLQASASGFGVSGSVNAAFNSGLSTASTHSSLSCDSYLVGASVPSTLNPADPDGMRNCALQMTLVDNPNAGTGVKGAAISFICATWDEFPQIQEALNAIGRSDAFSLDSAMGNLASLSAEYAALDYVINTCRDLQTNSSHLVLPFQNGLAGRLITGAAAGQHAIQSLTLSQLQSMSDAQLQALLISPQLSEHMEALSHQKIRFTARWHIDLAFVDGSDDRIDSTTRSWPLETFQSVATVDHRDGQAGLWIHVGRDDTIGYYLVPRWWWQNGQYFDGDHINIGGDTINTDVSTASWTGAAWNYVSVQLTNYP